MTGGYSEREAGPPLPLSPDDDDKEGTGRVEAFSDGVFAIVTTLLVLDLRVPHDPQTGEAYATAGELWQALLHSWPSFPAYLLGFSTVVIMWINHHMLFNFIKRTSHTLLLLNSLLLLAISVVPFPTALLSEYIGSGHEDSARVAAMVYSGLGLTIAFFYNLFWWHVSSGNRLIDRRADPEAVRTITRSYLFGPLVYVVAFVLSIFTPLGGLLANLVIAAFFALPNSSLRTIPLINQPAGENPTSH